MANIEATKRALGSIVKPRSLQEIIQASAQELGRALPEHMRPERLVRIALTCIRTTPKLSLCTQESFLGALFTSAQIGIEPIAGRAYIIPFNNSKKIGDKWDKVMEAQFVMGYKGVVELFYRHEKAVQLDWAEVRENDEFDYQYGSEAFLKHKPQLRDRGNVIAYWVQARLANGGKPFLVMSHADCMSHGMEHSKTYDKKTDSFYKDSPWFTDPTSMCLKTVFIQLAKLLPLSVEMQRAIQADESSRDYRKGMVDALDAPSTTNWNVSQIEEPKKEDEPSMIPGTSDIPFGD